MTIPPGWLNLYAAHAKNNPGVKLCSASNFYNKPDNVGLYPANGLDTGKRR
ncbi:MAG: hypothetical protein SV765_07235 [Pseudomonadota bacterium]|nr:hypothetical protein [Pseudomonadota bacterium]